jgi:hypothetical protein
MPTVTFATSCWENDWRFILFDPTYLQTGMIGNNSYDFFKKVLIINNVKDPEKVISQAEKKIKEGVISHYYLAQDFEEEMLSFFKLKREDFKAKENYKDDWVFFNATGVLTAIYLCSSDYLLYHTGDSFLEKKIEWIPKAIDLMEKNEDYKVANLTWNNNYSEAKKESNKTKKGFFISSNGFSDQQFLVKTEDFRQAIYNEIREDSDHFPRGDVFEKRVFSFMKNHGWKRITFRHGSYIHKNIS